jgi:hypothetical protein
MLVDASLELEKVHHVVAFQNATIHIDSCCNLAQCLVKQQMRSFALATPAEVIAQEYPQTQREGAMPYQEDRILTHNKEAGNFRTFSSFVPFMSIPKEEEECHIRLPSVDPKNNFMFFGLSKFCQILIQKNMISTCTKDFSWKRKWPKFSRFQNKIKFKLPDFYDMF